MTQTTTTDSGQQTADGGRRTAGQSATGGERGPKGTPDGALLQTALWYAKGGWHVFPLKAGDKTPVTAHGLHDATTDAETIRGWWAQWPTANIGLNCGASGLLAVDFDVHKEGYAGAALLKQLREEHPTTIAETGGGGYHLLYRQPEDNPLGNGRGALPKGVDVRGVGGYIVLAPSIHPNGNRYTWETGPHQMTPQALPGFLLAMLIKTPTPATAAPVHHRGYSFTDDLTRAAANLKRLRPGRADDYQEWVGVGMALSALGEAGLGLWDDWSRQSGKYAAGECEKKWRSFAPGDGLGLGSLARWADEDDPMKRQSGEAGRGVAHQVEGSPVDVLPDEDDDEAEVHPLDVKTPPLDLGWIDEYADLMTKLTGSPREFNVVCGLVTAATAIQRKARLRMSFADIYPNIYAAIIARSSVYHKSSALHKPRTLLQRAMLERLALSELMTSEGLLAQLQNQSSGVVIRDEIGTLFDSHRVKYLRTLKPDLTALFDCLPYSRRLSNLEIKVDAPYLNILGATTPARFYDAITATDWQDGFMARWLFVLPEGEPDFDAVAGLYEAQHDAEIGRLAVTLQTLDRQREQDFTLAGDAFQLWDGWQRQTAKDAYYYGDDTIAAVVTRYSAYALKFALVLAAVNGEWGRVTLPTMQTAMHLADSFKRSVARLLREKDEHLVSGAQLQKVFKAIQILNTDGKGVTTKSILQRAHLRKAQLTPCLEKLSEIGAIAYQKVGNGTRYWVMTEELPIRSWN